MNWPAPRPEPNVPARSSGGCCWDIADSRIVVRPPHWLSGDGERLPEGGCTDHAGSGQTERPRSSVASRLAVMARDKSGSGLFVLVARQVGQILVGLAAALFERGSAVRGQR